MNSIFKTISELKLMPVIVLDEPEKADQLSEALIAGGLPCAEITFRTPGAAQAVRKIAARNDMITAAGTILTIDQAKEAVDAGADFLIAPGFSRSLVEYCLDQGIVIIPGVCTPSEIQTALEYDLTVVKFFPAEAMGGLTFIKAISAPYPTMRFMPTGGINKDNLRGYLQHKSIFACGGSWLVTRELLKNNQFDQIRQLTLEAKAIIRETTAPL